MPVIVTNRHAKGYEGDIREVHQRYKVEKSIDTVPFKNIGRDVIDAQHQCVTGCKACYAGLAKGHICILACERCRLEKLPNYELEDGGQDNLIAVDVDVYVHAQNRIQTFDVQDVRPSE